MPIFRYTALNAQQQSIGGEIEADGVQQAIEQLEAGGVTVQSIGFAGPETAPAAAPPRNRATPSPAVAPTKMNFERSVLHSHIQQVVQQGRAFAPALRAYAEEMPSDRQRIELLSICSILESGDAVAAVEAFEAMPDYWIPLLSTAAMTGDPGSILRTFWTESKRSNDLRHRWWVTLTYPLIVVGTAGIVLTAASYLIVPTFENIFADWRIQLPGLTRIVLSVSRWATNWPAMVVLLSLAVLAALAMRNLRRWSPSAIASWLSNPFDLFFGRSGSIARFAQFAGDLINAGIDIPNAVRIAAFASKRPRLQRAGWRLANAIESRSASEMQACQSVLTASLIDALRCEMPSASRIRLLHELSCCHSDRARRQFAWTWGIIEPITIVVVGMVVGLLVIALFLPLVSLVSALSS